MTADAASIELSIGPAANIATAVLAKEAEVNALRQNHIQALQDELVKKQKLVEVQATAITKLREDFQYNLSLIHQRDEELADYDERYEAMEERIRALESSCEENARTRQEAESRARENQIRLRELETFYTVKLEEIRGQMESEKLSHNEAILRQRESFDSSRRSLQRALAERDEESESLRREMTRNIQSAVEAKQQDFQEEINALETKLQDVKKEKSELGVQVKELSKEKGEMTERIAELNSENSRLSKKVHETGLAMTNKEQESAKMRAAIQDSQAECQLLREDHGRVQALLSSKQVDFEESLKRERESSADQLAEFEKQRAQIEGLTSNLQFAESRSQELSRYIQTLEQDQKSASEAKHRLEEQLKTQDRENHRMGASTLDRLNDEIQLSAGREQALRREIQSIVAEKSLIEAKLKKFSLELQRLNNEHNEMANMKLALENERQARRQAESSLGVMKLSLQKAVDQRESVVKEAKGMREEVSSLKAQCDRFRKVISAMRGEMESLHAQIERCSNSDVSQIYPGEAFGLLSPVSDGKMAYFEESLEDVGNVKSKASAGVDHNSFVKRRSLAPRGEGLRWAEQRGIAEGSPIRRDTNSGQNHDRNSSSFPRTVTIEEKEILQLKQEMAVLHKEMHRMQAVQSNKKENAECSSEVRVLQAKLKKMEKHVDSLTKEKQVLMEMSNNLKSCLDRVTDENPEIDSPDVAVRIASELLSSVEESAAQVAADPNGEPYNHCLSSAKSTRGELNVEDACLYLMGKPMPSTTRPPAIKASQRVIASQRACQKHMQIGNHERPLKLVQRPVNYNALRESSG